MVFGERYSIYEKNGAIKYITHLDKFSYFLSYNLKYSDEMTVSQNNFNCAQKLSIIDMTISVSCFVCIEIIVFTLFA